MGAFLGVAAGSHQPPRMIVMRHEPPDAPGDLVLGLVGKAITFDTGGISLKPPLYMEDMKGDMAGGGAVITGMAALAELGTPVRAIAVVAATENMAGGGAYRPGDILRAGNGKTIEVLEHRRRGAHRARRRALVRAPRGRDAHRRLRHADRDDGEGARRPLRRRVRRPPTSGGTRSSPPARRPATMPGRSRCTRATAASSTPTSPTSRTSTAAARAARTTPPSSCVSSPATARGRTSTWRARASSPARAATTSGSGAAPATASG